MLIAHVITRFALGGMETGLVNLINRTESDSVQHAIISLTDVTDFARSLNSKIPLIALGKKPGWDLGTYYRLYRTFRRLQPTVVHTRNIGTIDAGAIAKLAGVPKVIHGEHGWDMADLSGSNWKYRLFRRVSRSYVTHFTCVSQHIQEWLHDAIGLKADDITQIYNGVDVERFLPGDSHSDVSQPEREIVVGWVGRMEQVKNPAGIVRGVRALFDSNPELRDRLRLVMVGDGSLAGSIAEQVRAAGLETCCELLGARDDVDQIIPTFDLYVQTSLNEGISNTILEAMSCACTVVATDVGGNRELVVDQVTGAIVPADDPDRLAEAIRHYVKHPNLLSEHGAAGRKRVMRKFTIERMTEQYSNLYQQIAAARQY